MQRSYAVYWNEAGGRRYAGRLELEPGYAQFAGGSRHGARRLFRIYFDDLEAVHCRGGRLRIARRSEPELVVGSVDGPGTLHEVADRLRASLLPSRLRLAAER